MPLPRLLRKGTALSACLVLAATAACMDEGDSIAGIPAGAADGVYPQLVLTGASEARSELRLSLLSKPEGVRLGSYQGEIRFDPATLTLETVRLPEGVQGSALQTEPGVVRFAAASLDGVADEPVLTLALRRTGTVRAAALSVTMEEVTAAEDLSDLTSRVAGTPLVVVR